MTSGPSIGDDSREFLFSLYCMRSKVTFIIKLPQVDRYGLIVEDVHSAYARGLNYRTDALRELLEWGFVTLRGTSNGLPLYTGRLDGDPDSGGIIELTDSGVSVVRQMKEWNEFI